jgi:hypothetical protein
MSDILLTTVQILRINIVLRLEMLLVLLLIVTIINVSCRNSILRLSGSDLLLAKPV